MNFLTDTWIKLGAALLMLGAAMIEFAHKIVPAQPPTPIIVPYIPPAPGKPHPLRPWKAGEQAESDRLYMQGAGAEPSKLAAPGGPLNHESGW